MEKKRKERESEKLKDMKNPNKTSNGRNNQIGISNKKARIEHANQTKSEGLKKAVNKVNILKGRYSNQMKDNVQSYCQICKIPQTFTRMRSHTKSRHGISITDY